MIQRDQWDTYCGAKKLIFLIRDIDDATMTAAPVESCRFVVLRSPRGRVGSELDMGSRLRRMRERFHRWIPMRTGAQLPTCLHHDPPKFSIQSSRGVPRTGACGVSDYPTPDLSQSESGRRSASENSKYIWTRWHPSPLKTSITRGPPVVAVAVSSDPILPHR